MKYLGTTPIHEFDGKFVKREDLAYWTSLEYPSGSKVRQYLDMAHRSVQREGFPPCLVPCSANSAMQIYVAATAKQLNTKGIIYVPGRKVRSDATKYAIRMGAELNEIRKDALDPKLKGPGHLSVAKTAARQRAIDIKHYVEWDRKAAIKDTIDQCQNIPENIKRIIVPTGSGLTAAGIMCGTIGLGIEIGAVCTSPMADKPKSMQLVNKMGAGKERKLGALTVLGPTTPYDTPVIDSLPDGTPLDIFYAAKAWEYTQPGDLFWPPGLRPICSMPEICQREFKNWKGPE